MDKQTPDNRGERDYRVTCDRLCAHRPQVTIRAGGEGFSTAGLEHLVSIRRSLVTLEDDKQSLLIRPKPVDSAELVTVVASLAGRAYKS